MTTTTTAATSPTSPTRRLEGRHALVTGSTSGIGAAIARRLAAEGARVVVSGRDPARGRAVAEEVGGTFLPVELTAGADELRAFAAAATEVLDGRVDVLVNNAAVCPAVTTADLTDADLDAALFTNVRAPHVLVAALAPAMAARGSGVVVNTGSWMASVGSPFVGLYAATKAAEQQLTRSWAAEFGPYGVRVNTVAPGVTRTPINEGDGAVLDAIVAGTPAGRSVRPDEVAHAVAWLCSDEAAAVHGITLPVDGGIGATRPM